MKKISRVHIYLLVIYIVIAILVLLFYNLNSNEGFLVLPGSNVYYRENRKLIKYDKNFDELKNMKIVTKTEVKEASFKIEGETVKFYQKDNEFGLDDTFILAHSKSLKFDLADYQIEDLDTEDMKKVDQILQEHGIIGYENLNTKFKILFDYDNNGSEEILYFVSNLFDETKYDKVFSFAYYIYNDEIIYLIEQIDTIENTYDLCIPSIHSIIKFDRTKDFNILLSCEYFDNIGINYEFYKFNDGKFEVIK